MLAKIVLEKSQVVSSNLKFVLQMSRAFHYLMGGSKGLTGQNICWSFSNEKDYVSLLLNMTFLDRNYHKVKGL